MATEQGQPPVTGLAAELRIGSLWLDSTLCLRAFDPVVAALFGTSISAFVIGQPFIDQASLPASFRNWISLAALDLRQPSRWADARCAAGIAPAMGGGWTVWVLERTTLDCNDNSVDEMLAAIPSPVFFTDAHGRCRGCNKAFEACIGIPRHELIGKTVFDVEPSGMVDVHLESDRNLLKGKGVQSYQAKVRYADASLRDVLFRKAVFYARSGEVAGIVGVMFDVTEQKRLEREYRLAASVFDNAAEAITITDSTPAILKVNRAFTEITGYREDEVVGKNPSVLSSGRQDKAFYRNMWRQLTEDGCWFGEIANRRKNGEEYPEWLSISAVCDEAGQTGNFIGIFTDISQAKNAEAKIERLSLYDALTELPNRTLFVDRLHQAVTLADRRRHHVGVLLVGLDGLRQINDTLGYGLGDEMLRAVGQRLQSVLRSGDTVARYMSDQFVVLLFDLLEISDAGIVTGNILQALASPFSLQGRELTVGASIGVAVYPRDGATPEALIRGADVAMHRAKREGGNHFLFFSPELEHNSLERLTLESSLRSALERQQFVLHYQPQVDLESRALVGVEALIRWEHPEQGMILPSRFIPLAEESGQIIPIGDWVLQTACRQAKQWLDAGHALPVAVNLSARQFRQCDIVEKIEKVLTEVGLPPELLELELTESMVMHDPERAVTALRRLRDMGVKVSMDDFGTGYSSLSYLKRFEIDKLKIDRSFVSALPHDAYDQAIASAVIALGKSLKLRVVAEGVETLGQLGFLQAQGCDGIQGFYFSRPVAAAFISSMLDNKRDGLPMQGKTVVDGE